MMPWSISFNCCMITCMICLEVFDWLLMFFKTIILYKIIFLYILKLSMFIMVCADFFYCCFGRSVSCNRLQAVRLSVIDYNIHVVDYVIDYNILVIDYRASVSINSKFQKPRERDFYNNSTPKSLKLQNSISPSILNQITSHKTQN